MVTCREEEECEAIFRQPSQPGIAPANRNCSWAAHVEGWGRQTHEPTLGELEGQLSEGR